MKRTIATIVGVLSICAAGTANAGGPLVWMGVSGAIAEYKQTSDRLQMTAVCEVKRAAPTSNTITTIRIVDHRGEDVIPPQSVAHHILNVTTQIVGTGYKKFALSCGNSGGDAKLAQITIEKVGRGTLPEL